MKLLCAISNEKVSESSGRYCSAFEPMLNEGQRCCKTCANHRPENDPTILALRTVPPSLGENTGLACKLQKRMCKRGEGLKCKLFVASRAYIDHYCSNCEHSFNYKPEKD